MLTIRARGKIGLRHTGRWRIVGRLARAGGMCYLVLVATALFVGTWSSDSVGQDRSLEALRIWAERGNALAQYDLAVIYGKGQGVKQDPKEALKWLRRAAEQ